MLFCAGTANGSSFQSLVAGISFVFILFVYDSWLQSLLICFSSFCVCNCALSCSTIGEPLSVGSILLSSGMSSKSFTPGKICVFGSVSSGNGFLRGLPLFPFGFGGSTGYLRGLPLPLLTGCATSCCDGTSFICIWFSAFAIVSSISFLIGCCSFSKSLNPGSIFVSCGAATGCCTSSKSSNPGNVFASCGAATGCCTSSKLSNPGNVFASCGAATGCCASSKSSNPGNVFASCGVATGCCTSSKSSNPGNVFASCGVATGCCTSSKSSNPGNVFASCGVATGCCTSSKSSNPGNVFASCGVATGCCTSSKSSNPGNVFVPCGVLAGCCTFSKSSNPGKVLCCCVFAVFMLLVAGLGAVWAWFVLSDSSAVIVLGFLFFILLSSSSVYTFLSFLTFMLFGIITFPVILCSLCLLSNRSIPLLAWFVVWVAVFLGFWALNLSLWAFRSASLLSFSTFCFSFLSFSICSTLLFSWIFCFCFLSSSVSSAYVTNSWYFGHSASNTALTFIGKHFIIIFNCLSVYCDAMLLKLSVYLSSFFPNLL